MNRSLDNQPGKGISADLGMLLAYLIRAAPYLVSSALAWVVSDNSISAALAVGIALLALRGLFGITERSAEGVKWRVGEGKRLYALFLAEFHRSEFPDPSKLLHSGTLDYLARMDNHTDDPSVRVAAKEMHKNISLALHNLSEREKSRYLKVLSKAFLDWFVERWRPELNDSVPPKIRSN